MPWAVRPLPGQRANTDDAITELIITYLIEVILPSFKSDSTCALSPSTPHAGCTAKPSQGNVSYDVYCNGIPYADGGTCLASCVTNTASITAPNYPTATCHVSGGVGTWTYVGGCLGGKLTEHELNGVRVLGSMVWGLGFTSLD